MAARRWLFWAIPIVLTLMGMAQLSGGDLAGARALHVHAESVALGDWSHPIWVDVHREWSRIRPWQAGYNDARRHAAEVAAGRRSMLRE